jgi:hypothetical protein
MKPPPVTLRRLFDVIYSHVTPLQKAAILEDLEALQAEMDEPERAPPPLDSPLRRLRPALNCVLGPEGPPPA